MAATQNSSVGADDLILFDDCAEAVVRPISAADSAALLRFHAHLSAGSVRQRFFYPHTDLSPSEVVRFTQVDGQARVALVIECGSELLAVARYDRLDDHGVAEVAFVVADAYQHHGLATILLHRLAKAARSAGITRFIAEVLAENRSMLSVFRNAGFPIESKTDSNVVELIMSIDSDPTVTPAG
jgi:RimJ/RimL family protein N-acetyltransferase